MRTNGNVTASPRHTNALAREKSPYLLQHQHNPVDWHPWGEAAFNQARTRDKPIFLSIGYSTCHWCHVMERESFENERVATFLNEHFVSIKVDREERPDVDKIYMTFVQATTGQGGWPLNVFLTPDLKPFFGGTYYPPENRHGRPGLLHLLQQIQQLWATRRNDLTNSAAEMHRRLEQATATKPAAAGGLSASTLRAAGELFKSHYDPRHGGFGGAPKFPQPCQPQFLLRYALRFGDQEAVRMVLHTCERMAAGGILDQLGGGFSRYAVDAEWLVPHFEKMLYDNAQLVQLYLDAWLVSHTGRFAEVARDTVNYVLRDMTHPQGGFYSAEDADSEGHEGKFYCWTTDELSHLLSPEEYEAATRYFGITKNGNFIDHSHPEPLPGQNVLSVVEPQLSGPEQERLAVAKAKMLQARRQRVRPGLDDKILSSWNGLMLGAVARAGVVLQEPAYLAAASKNYRFLLAHLWDSRSKTLFHRWREGERDQVQLLEAYAFLLSGVLDLYEASLELEYLQFAMDLANSMLSRFYDSEHAGFWQSGAHSSDLVLRVKADYDGAEPSGNSVAVLSLLRLGSMTGRNEYAEAGLKTLHAFSERLNQLPQAVPCLLQALDFSLQEPLRAVITAPPDALPPLLAAVHSACHPNKVVLGTSGPVEPFARALPAQPPNVYICTGTTCQNPTADPDRIRQLLA